MLRCPLIMAPPRLYHFQRAIPLCLVLLVLVLNFTGCAPRLMVAPAGDPGAEVDAVRTALEQLGPDVRWEHLTATAEIRLPDETVLSGGQLVGMLDGPEAGHGRIALKRRTTEVYACPGYALEIGRVHVERNHPGGSVAEYNAGWYGEWVEVAEMEWRLRAAQVGGQWPWRTGAAAACVTATEQRLARRRQAIVVHAPAHVAAAGGLIESVSSELEFNGWDGQGCDPSSCPSSPYPEVHHGPWISASYRHRIQGGWGAEAVAGLQTGWANGYSAEQNAEARITASVGHIGVLATYELRYLRLGVGPVLVRSWTEWDLPEPEPTARVYSYGLGWLNQAAATIPLTGRFYLDLAFQDRLFGYGAVPGLDASDPSDAAASTDLRQSGSALVVGLGVKY